MNVRRTNHRDAILNELRASGEHLSAQDLHRRVSRRIPRLGLTTVYRNLECLVQLGEVRALDSVVPPMLYDARTQPHLHVRCTRCGRAQDIAISLPDCLSDLLNAPSSFRVTGARFDLLGVCPECDVTKDGNVP